jgi:hypothetical protein
MGRERYHGQQSALTKARAAHTQGARELSTEPRLFAAEKGLHVAGAAA